MNFEIFNQDYVTQLITGDNETERHFIAYFSELIDLKLRSRLKSQEDLEEIRKEVFARALHLLRSPSAGFRQAERLGPLINTITNNVFLERMRRGHNASGPGESFPVDNQDMASRGLRKMIEEMPQRDSAVLRAIFFEERDRDEVLREYGVDRDHIRVLLHRVKNSFRSAYSKVNLGEQVK